MPFSAYHEQYAALPDAEIARRAAAKDDELTTIFASLPPPAGPAAARVAVLGCGDRRLVAHHRAIMEKHLRRPVELTTFDVTVDHLFGETGVVRHDCTEPLPEPPYDLAYAHVLLKFIVPEKQWDLLNNSYQALNPGGLAVHVLDRQDYETREPMLPDGGYSVPLERLEARLEENGISYRKIPVKFGQAVVLIRK